jgi:hypothetical protein
MKKFVRIALIISLCAAARADVVRPAPNFAIEGVAKGSSLRSFRGQAVVLLITWNSRRKEFREQLEWLKQLYGQFSTEKVIFVAAVENGPEEVPSDIPFVTAANPRQVAADYGVNGRFAIAVIGVDGNLDMITSKAVPAERVRNVVFNNFESQTTTRKVDQRLGL